MDYIFPEFSFVFAVILIALLGFYLCCRMICSKQPHLQSRQSENVSNCPNRGRNLNRRTASREVYTISTPATEEDEENGAPNYKTLNLTIDPPPSYDEAITLGKVDTTSTTQEPTIQQRSRD